MIYLHSFIFGVLIAGIIMLIISVVDMLSDRD